MNTIAGTARSSQTLPTVITANIGPRLAHAPISYSAFRPATVAVTAGQTVASAIWRVFATSLSEGNDLVSGPSQTPSVEPRSIVNITVHGIGTPERELDPGEAQTWVSVAQFEQVLDTVAETPDARISFDDGNASDVEIALPRLVERGLIAEFFVLAGELGDRGRVDRAGVRALLEAGMVIGSHGWSHRNWRRVDDAAAREEFGQAPRVLGELAGRPISRVAIPFGSYDRHVLRRLRAAAVTRVYTSDGGRARPDAWLQPRNSLHHDVDADWIARVLDPHASLTRRARENVARAVKRLRG
jgi:peptidoglycan/xylan/chitin deacetylase (PgdA/CDA1 family)